MQKPGKSSISRVLTLGFLVLGLVGNARADKTLMWLVDWFQMGNVDTITTIKSVQIPNYNGTSGYYYGTKPQALIKTNAYAAPIPVHSGYRNDTLPDSLKIPTEVPRNWWAIPNFNTSNYQTNRIRIYMTYSGQMHMPMLNRPDPKVQVDPYASGEGQTDQLEGSFVNGCIDSTFGDTVWFWTGARTAAQVTSNASAASIKCLDHNPFFEKIGTVHVLNPWPGKTVYVQMGTTWYPLYQEPGRPGWVFTTLWADPRTPQQFKIRLANGDPAKSSNVQYWDASGLGASPIAPVLLDYSASPGKGGEVWIVPPFTGATKAPAVKAPPVALTLYVKRPAWSASAVRVVEKGLEARFIASATKYCDWFKIEFYAGAVPTQIALTNPMGDTVYGSKGKARAPSLFSTFTDWIDISTQAASGGTFSVNTDANTPAFASGVPATGGLCDTKLLAFSAYDYAWTMPATHFYEPFSETGPDNNCPGSGNTATKGLVLSTLDPVTGMPVMNSAHKAACGIDTKVPSNSPGYWFDTLWKAADGTISNVKPASGIQLNYFHCVPVPLKLDAAGQYYTFSNSTFFPLDTANIPTPYGKGSSGTDFKFAMHAKAAFEYVPGLKFEFQGDDDVWIFIDKKLALDVGGQHGPIGGSINVDNLGLQEGKSYQFDMFYTERQGLGSSISIKTTMNLVPIIEVGFDTTKSVVGKQVIESWVSETTADASKCPESGNTSVVNKRDGNPVYTLMFPDGSEMRIDSAYVAGLMPGFQISQNGSRLDADTSKLQKSGKLTQTGLYQLRVELGTETRTVSWSNISHAVEVTGVMMDANGDGSADSVVLFTAGGSPAFTKTYSAVLRWADRAGLPDSVEVPSTSLVRLPGDSIMIGTFVLPPRTSCPPTGCKGAMGWAYTGFGVDTVNNPITLLADGMPPVADSAWLVYDTTGLAMDTLYVIASEDLVANAGAVPANLNYYALTGRAAAARPVPGIGILSGTLLKIALDPNTNPVQPGDSIRLGGLSADILGNGPGERSKWVYLKADPVAKSWMLDVNGDGAPDSIGIAAKGDLSKSVSAEVHWTTASGADTTFNVATPSGVTTGIKLPAGILQNATFCAGCYLVLDMGTTNKRFTLLDSVAPVALGAKLRYGQLADTLLVTVSEAIELASQPAGEGYVALKNAGQADRLGTLLAGTASGTATLQMVVAPGAVEADSVRLRSWILGNLKKAVGQNSPFVKIEYGPQPIRVAVWDNNGDGMVDSVAYRLTRSAAGAPAMTGFGLKWGGVEASVPATLARSADGFSWGGNIGPLAPLTAPSANDKGWFVVGTDVASYTALVEDSVAPVAMEAALVFGLEATDPDTVRVKVSESFVAALTGTWVMLGADSASATPTSLTDLNSKRTASTVSIDLVVPPGSIANDMAWARLGTGVSDGGKSVGVSSKWVPLKLKPSGRAYLFDANGDGQADSMRVYMRGALAAHQAVLSWKTVSGAVSERIWTVSPSVGPFGTYPADPQKWFEKGATSCSDCKVKFLDASGGEIVEWPLIDSVAPMAISGSYSFGSTQDTLTVTFSEALASVDASKPWLEWGNTVVGGAILHSAMGPVGSTVSFYLSSSNGAVSGWDSVRLASGGLAGSVTDAVGKRVGATSPWAPISYGIAPFTAYLLDPEGQGRGTHVRVKLDRAQVPSAAVSTISGFRFSWTDGSGKATEDRSALVSELAWDASTSSWTGALSTPFALGRTGCTGVCGALASSSGGSTRGGSLLDSVPPSAVWAKFRYSLPEVAQDTLVIGLSEPWVGEQAGNNVFPFASVGNSSSSVEVSNFTTWSLENGTTLKVVVASDIGKKFYEGDSTRLAYQAAGSRIWDASNNLVGLKSRWVPIEFGLRPPRLEVKPYQAFLQNTGATVWPEPAPSVPQVEILEVVQAKDGTSSYQKLETSGGAGIGMPPVNNLAQTLGVEIRINRPLEGVLIIYDNIGTAVASVDLTPLKRLWDGDPDDEKTVQIAWNGTDANHKFVSSGVYLFRAVVKYEDKEGNKDFRNIVWKLGFYRNTK